MVIQLTELINIPARRAVDALFVMERFCFIYAFDGAKNAFIQLKWVKNDTFMFILLAIVCWISTLRAPFIRKTDYFLSSVSDVGASFLICFSR